MKNDFEKKRYYYKKDGDKYLKVTTINDKVVNAEYVEEIDENEQVVYDKKLPRIPTRLRHKPEYRNEEITDGQVDTLVKRRCINCNDSGFVYGIGINGEHEKQYCQVCNKSGNIS